MPGADGFDGLSVLGLTVFDVLGFVEDDGVELVGAVEVGVASEEGVAGDDEVVLVEFRELRVTRGTVQDEHAQGGGEFGRFGRPIEHERGGADHETGQRRITGAGLIGFGR